MKIKLVHILTDINSVREIKSIESISVLNMFDNIEYKQQINNSYKGKVPICLNESQERREGHYGAYLSFKKAIKDNFTNDIDALMLFECDSVLNVSPIEFYELIYKSLNFCKKNNIYQFSFGGNYWMINNILNAGNIIEEFEDFLIVDQIIRIHSILLTKESRDFYLSKIENVNWNTPDVWLNNMVTKQASTRTEIVYQYEGDSLIENGININSTKQLPWYTQFNFSYLKKNIKCEKINNIFKIKINTEFKEKLKLEFIYDDNIIYREYHLFKNNIEYISQTTFNMKDNNKIKIKFYLSNSDFYLFYKNIE